MMPTQILTGTSRLTLINVFETAPETQQQLIDTTIEQIEQTVSKLPGLISANLHASRDGLRVVNYAQWESVAAWEAMMSNRAAGEKRDEIEAIAKPDVHQYDVVATYEGAAA
jgi:heme-degrading monooxygenase HmoA